MSNQRRTAVHSDEKALVQRARAGDADAFGVLYLHYLDSIYRYIYFRVEDEVVAEDLAEDVFVRAWEALPRFTMGEHPFVTWLYSIARNAIIDHHRRHKNKPLSEISLRTLRMPDSSPEDHADGQRNVSLLCEALSRLTDEEQQLIILRFAEGLSHQEVAAILGKSDGACRVIQHRALSTLQAWLKHDMG